MAKPGSYQSILTSAEIHQQMADVIQEVNLRLRRECNNGWRLRPIVFERSASSININNDALFWSQCDGGDSARGNPAHYCGMMLVREPTSRNGKGDQEAAGSIDLSESGLLITFYLAYSTWDGRCVHIDQLPRGDAVTYCPMKPVALLQVLAKVAIRLGCRRLLWMQSGDPDWSFADGKDDSPMIKPEILDDWLIFKMDRFAMESHAGKSANEESAVHHEAAGTEADTSKSVDLDRPTIERKIQQACSDQPSASSLRWRLVVQDGMEQDARSIFDLVQGLAIYENEPDAVQCRATDYLMDGNGSHPLFYCLLLEDTSANEPTACGMAFIYFGYSSAPKDCKNTGGRFLYLEDLYLEPPFRRHGAGKAALKSLTKMGLALDCQYLLWTALDWNQPALNLYSKMGAVVQDGLRISRYKDDDLLRFARAASD